MFAPVKRWGNSFAIRLTKRDMQDVGLREGDMVRVTLRKVPARGRIDLSGLPTFTDTDSLASEHHDELLYGARRARR